MPKQEIPKINDPYVGEVYGNILDNYHSSTYNLKLYMMRKEFSVEAKDGIASLDDSLTCEPKDQIILAQTGVTAATIDDLEIEALTSTDGPNAVGINFTVIQPGAATFLDQLQLARAYLGQENDFMPIVFLEIRFQGLEADIEDEDKGGEFVEIAGPYRYKLHITKISAEINEEGSTYDIETIPAKSFAFTSPLFKIPSSMTTTGTTITEHVTSLEQLLREHHEDTADTHEVPDEIEFDLSALIGSEEDTNEDGTAKVDRINDETVYSSSDPAFDQRNSLMRTTFAIGDAVTNKNTLLESPRESGDEVEEIITADGIIASQDMTMEKYFAILLSMNAEFLSKITRKEVLDDAEAEADKTEAHVIWFKMDSKLEQLKFDKKRNAYATKVIFKPRIYKSSRPDIMVDGKELAVSKEDYSARAREIFAEGGLLKAYHYIFSGLNDQIKSLDIKYDNGIALLVAPKGGAVGQATVVMAEKEGAVAQDQDTTLEGVVEDFVDKNKQATAKDIWSNFLDDINKIKDVASDGLSGLVQQLEDATGLDQSFIADALQGNNEANQKALEEALDGKTASKILQNNTIAATEPFPEYEPELSDFKYSVDLTNPMETPLTASELEELGYFTLEGMSEVIPFTPRLDSGENTATGQDSGAATVKKGSVENTLFGVIASQHSNDLAFLISLDMEIRGDPWYLGKDTEDESNPDAANWYQNDNHFYLGVRSPKTFDMDWRDEDSEINTGYWKGDGVSRSFGGVYRLISVVNKFSGGEYSVDVTAQRIVPAQEPGDIATDGTEGFKAETKEESIAKAKQMEQKEADYIATGGKDNPSDIEIEASYYNSVPARPIGVKGDYDSFFSDPIPGTETFLQPRGIRLNARQWDYQYGKTHLPDGRRIPTVPVGEDD